MLDPKCRHVNVEGVGASIGAAMACDVGTFIYLSTYNVVFHGQEIEAGDESLPYSPSNCHTDCYSPSKSEAEKLVLSANGRGLRTCALRPAAIYGVGEQRHIPRIVRMIDLGFNLRIGRATVDWLHVDNLVQAIMLACLKLSELDNKTWTRVPAGRSYFISDNDPMDNFANGRPMSN